MMNDREILKIAMEQSAVDLCAAPEDFYKNENVVVISQLVKGARRYQTADMQVRMKTYTGFYGGDQADRGQYLRNVMGADIILSAWPTYRLACGRNLAG